MSDEIISIKDYIENYNYVGWLDKLSEGEVRHLLEEITWKLHDLGNKVDDGSLEISYGMSKGCRCGCCSEWGMTVGNKGCTHEYFIGCILGDLGEQ